MREMKDSGIEWIGEIAKEFQILRLKNVANILDQFRKPITADQRNQDADVLYDYYGASGVIDKIDGYTIDDHVMLIGEDGANLRMRNLPLMYEINGKAWINNHAHILKPKENVLFRYLFLTLEGLDINPYITGSAQPKLSQENLKNIWLPVPSLTVQQTIVDGINREYTKVDALITNVQTQIEKLKEYKQSLITEAVTKGLDPNVPMKDSGVEWIGEIPEHWDVIRLKHLYDYSNGSPVRVGPFGSALPSSDIIDEGVWVYNQRTVLDQNFETNNTFVSEEKANELAGFAVFPKDILITTRGSIGKTVIVPDNAPRGVLHPCVIRFRIDSVKMDNSLLSLIFNETNICQGQIMDMSNSTTIEVLYSYSLKEIWIPCPPIREQKKLFERVREMIRKFDKLISIKQTKIEKLEQYKKSLIYEYVTGKKEVL